MSITVIIIAITVIASIYAWNNPERYQRWMMNPYKVVTKNQYDRLILSGFIHADYMHLFFNMFTLYFFGETLEFVYGQLLGNTLGGIAFVGMYLLGIIISDLPTLRKHKANPYYNALGASGGVSAVVFGSILFFPTNQLCLYGFICLPGFIFAALYMIYSYYMSKKGNDAINHDAHLYGAVFGIFSSILLSPPVIIHFFEEILSFRLF